MWENPYMWRYKNYCVNLQFLTDHKSPPGWSLQEQKQPHHHTAKHETTYNVHIWLQISSFLKQLKLLAEAELSVALSSCTSTHLMSSLLECLRVKRLIPEDRGSQGRVSGVLFSSSSSWFILLSSADTTEESSLHSSPSDLCSAVELDKD